jgi:hypothetical protein
VSKVDPVAGSVIVSGDYSRAYAKKPDDTARIAAMSFADYVAELHAALDPRGAGL